MAMRVDLWHVRTDALDDGTRAACAALLTSEEDARRARFVFERHRQEYLVTRGLERGVLATYVEAPPRDLAFTRTEHGRPLLSGGRGASELRFNLTNTVEMVACGVVRGAEIGIDAEPLSRADQILDIATTVFTAHELRALERLELAARRRRAVELWTLKEAYMKARGLGFSLPVKGFEIVFDPTDPASLSLSASRLEGGHHRAGVPALSFHPMVEDAPLRWALSTLEVDGHLISTCIERTNDGPPEIALRRADLAALLRG